MKSFQNSLEGKSTEEIIDIVDNLSAISYSPGGEGVKLPLAEKLSLSDYEKLDELLTVDKNGRSRLMQGRLWQTYIFWHPKGEDRNPFLKKALNYYEMAVKDTSIDDDIGVDARLSLAEIIIEYPAIRDLNRGISLMDSIYNINSNYIPEYSTFLQALNLDKQYKRTIEVANNIINKSQHDTAPAVYKIKGKALRSIVRDLKKSGRIDEAIQASDELIETPFHTENDAKINVRLKAT